MFRFSDFSLPPCKVRKNFPNRQTIREKFTPGLQTATARRRQQTATARRRQQTATARRRQQTATAAAGRNGGAACFHSFSGVRRLAYQPRQPSMPP